MSRGRPSRCTGHCCTNFHLPLSPEQLMDSYKRWLSSQGGREPLVMNDVKVPLVHADIHLIAPMVEYLGDGAPQPRLINPSLYASGGEKNYRYRCKHFDRKTRNCTIYEIRPWMCRYYPGPGGCNYAACTWKEKKQEKDKPRKKLSLESEIKEAEVHEPEEKKRKKRRPS